jgi:hypothetical protein
MNNDRNIAVVVGCHTPGAPARTRHPDESTMSAAVSSPASSGAFTLRYDSLHQTGRRLCFPCDARGRIDLDALTDRARTNYLAARATVGRDFAYPVIEPATSREDDPSFAAPRPQVTVEESAANSARRRVVDASPATAGAPSHAPCASRDDLRPNARRGTGIA